MEKIVKRIVVIMIAVAIVGILSRIIYINQLYPSRAEKYIEFNQKEILDNNINMTIKDALIVDDYDELASLYNKCGLDEDNICKVLFVEVSLENPSEKNIEYELYELYLETSNKVNGIMREVYFEINDADMIVNIPAGQELNITLPYELTKQMFLEDEYLTLENQDMFLVMKRYPVKEFWKIEI